MCKYCNIMQFEKIDEFEYTQDLNPCDKVGPLMYIVYYPKSNKFELCSISDDTFESSFPIQYCPVCGRKLQ